MIENRLTVGIVTSHAAAGPEVELPAVTSGRVATVVFRARAPSWPAQETSGTDPPAHAELRASTEPAAISRAASTFNGLTLSAVAVAALRTF